MTMWTADFWKDTGDRAIRTFAQTSLSLLTVGQAFAEIDWVSVGSIGGVAAVISVLTSVAWPGKDAPVHTPKGEVVIPDGDGDHRAKPVE